MSSLLVEREKETFRQIKSERERYENGRIGLTAKLVVVVDSEQRGRVCSRARTPSPSVKAHHLMGPRDVIKY